MGRGRSNWTKLYWAQAYYMTEYVDQHSEAQYHYRTFRRQVTRSRWFNKHFITHWFPPKQNFLNWLDLNIGTAKPLISNPTQAWFRLATQWPLETASFPRKIKANKYSSLGFSPQEARTELEYRKRAQFYLILVQHFLGREEAKKLLAHYKKHGVKYRKVRTDQGLKLSGSELTEFKMKLQGHSLFIETPTAETPKEYDD